MFYQPEENINTTERVFQDRQYQVHAWTAYLSIILAIFFSFNMDVSCFKLFQTSDRRCSCANNENKKSSKSQLTCCWSLQSVEVSCKGKILNPTIVMFAGVHSYLSLKLFLLVKWNWNCTSFWLLYFCMITYIHLHNNSLLIWRNGLKVWSSVIIWQETRMYKINIIM